MSSRDFQGEPATDADFTAASETAEIDYAGHETPYTVSSMLSGLQTTHPGQDGASLSPLMSPYLGMNNGGVDYLYQDEVKQRGGRGFNQRLCYNTGAMYGLGLSVGGAWGLAEGLRSPVGSNAKLRVNAVLNACTRRGPLVGNSAGVATLLFTGFSYGIGRVRGEDDMWNSVLGAGFAGLLFKSTAGAATALKTSAVFAGTAAFLSGAYEFYQSRENYGSSHKAYA